MFANINDVYLFHNAILNKNQSGSITPQDFNLFINAAQQQYFRLKLGLPELYTVEKRQAGQEIMATQVIDDCMRPFIKSVSVAKTGQGFTVPTDLAAYLPSGFTYTYQNPDGTTAFSQQPLDFVALGEFWARGIDYVTPPAFDYPIATWMNGQLLAQPVGITSVNMYYYRYPVTPVFAFTLTANDQIVYDPVNSVQLEFPNLDWENIAWIAINYSSDYLREEFIKQASEKRITAGM